MALRVYALGRVLADGGTTFVVEGAPALSAITWLLTGGGTLTPMTSSANSSGVATAIYRASAGTPATSGSTVTVGATVYG